MINKCGNHLQGRQYLFLPKIIDELEKQTCEKYFDGNLNDDIDEENLDELGDQELTEYLAGKTINELQNDKYKPLLSRVKNACDKETFQKFYAKIVANSQQAENSDEMEVDATEKPDELSHKKLKGAIYLLEKGKSASQWSYLFNGHNADLCAKIWPLVLRVRCDKKSVNQLVSAFMGRIMDKYTTIEFENRFSNGRLIFKVQKINNFRCCRHSQRTVFRITVDRY